jgi:hypothetical protein
MSGRRPATCCRHKAFSIDSRKEKTMLKDKASTAIVAVSDIARATAFYRDTLGLDVTDDSMGDVVVFRTGDTSLVVYRSEFAGTNKANAVVWGVGDEIDDIVANLASKGVRFEHYEIWSCGATSMSPAR